MVPWRLPRLDGLSPPTKNMGRWSLELQGIFEIFLKYTFIGWLNSGMLIRYGLNLFFNTTLHGPTPAPQDECTPHLQWKWSKRYQLSSGGQISTSVSRWDEFVARHDPHLNGRPPACAGKVSTAAGRIYLSRETSRWPSGASTCLNDFMETSEQQLQWGLARILVIEHDFMILLRLPGAGWCGGFSFEGVVTLT